MRYLDPKNDLTFKKVFGQQVLWLRYLTEIEDGTEHFSSDLLEIPEVREAIEQMLARKCVYQRRISSPMNTKDWFTHLASDNSQNPLLIMLLYTHNFQLDGSLFS